MMTNPIHTASLPVGIAKKSVERTGTAYILVPEGAEARVRSRLEELGERISNANPEVRTRTFITPAGSIYLNCYLELSLSGREESLIAAIAYRNNLGRFVVSADVCGEESGTLVWERPDVEVNPNDIQQLDQELYEATEDLFAHSVDSIREALK